MDSKITIDCKEIKLEAVLNENSLQKAVIITHPHPLYGGNMDNSVVMSIEKAFFNRGFTTLKFNFRGTCNSTGMFDDGNGEQDDVLAALSFLEKKKGFERILLAGYSFGARINAKLVAGGCKIDDHIMISPPVGFMSFDDIEKMPHTGLIISGDNDEIAPSNLIQEHIAKWGLKVQYKTIKNCDHFYSDSLGQLEGIIDSYLKESFFEIPF
ncbi:MAG: alpha/beta hydrolase [Deltaproteobacteria bacterium]|jgi:alpha/beta superfamily hydrolase|nr:alpha/beta hydrolase [Deltaproteobacteria bacterium]